MHRSIFAAVLIALSLGACSSGNNNVMGSTPFFSPGKASAGAHFVSEYPPTADWVILDTCTRAGSNCPGANLDPEGEYRMVGKTFIFRQPVIAYIVSFNNKTYARGRVYTDPAKGGEAFEGAWVSECEARGRTGSSSSVYSLTRLDCLPPEEQAKWIK